MTDVGMGGNLPKTLQTNKIKENAQIDRKEALKEREALAGTKQAEGKLKKEDVKRTTDRYKAFKSAYQYLLGEEPEEGQVDEDMESAPLEEEEELKKDLKVKPNLKEIEEYKVRDRFKAKLGLLLGDDFDEDAPLDNDEDLNTEERTEDTKSRLELARDAYSGLIQYISDSLGEFDFDNIDDSKLFLKYGIPEDAIIKFIMLQQLSRAGSDFPNVMDMSIMVHKFKKLQISLALDNINELISTDYGTAKRLKYTVSGFVYVPLLEVMTKIEDDLKISYQHEFNKLLDETGLEPFSDLKEKFPENAMFRIKNILSDLNMKINETARAKSVTLQGLTSIALKNKDSILEKANNLNNDLKQYNTELEEIELRVAKIIFIYNFINSGLTISEFNKVYPITVMNQTFSILGVRYTKPHITNFINKKVNVNSLKPGIVIQKEEQKRNIEMSESKIKNAIMAISKQPPPKQQQMLKNIRVNSFDLSTNFYWLKQKKLNEVIESSEILSNLFDG